METKDPRWLTDEEQRVWRRLAALVMYLPYELDAQLQRDAELTHFGYLVLAMLSESPDRRLRMSELAARTNASLSRLSHMVSKFEERGWVSRCKSVDDGRGNVAMLTDEGHAKLVETAPGHVEAVQRLVFDVLSPTQVRQLEGICDAVLAGGVPEQRRTAS